MGRRRNNEGTIYFDEKRSLYVVQVTSVAADGHKSRPKTYFKTQKEAVAAKTQALEQIRRGDVLLENSQLLDAFIESWLARTVAVRSRPRTHQTYTGLMKRHVLPTLGKVRLDRLTPAHVQDLLSRKLEEGLSPGTVERIRDVLRNALNQALSWGMVSRNVALLASPPRVERAELTPWTLNEAQRFLDASRHDRLYAAFLLTALTGMRRGELLGLLWEDIDLDARILELRASAQRIAGQGVVRGPLKTRASRRKLALSALLCDALVEHKKLQELEREFAGERWKETGYVFTSSVGTSVDPRNLTRRFSELSHLAGVPHRRFHDLRHFAATVQLMDGAPINAVQQLLGHSKASTTLDIYAHVSPVVNRDRADRMAELVRAGLRADAENCPTNCPTDAIQGMFELDIRSLLDSD